MPHTQHPSSRHPAYKAHQRIQTLEARAQYYKRLAEGQKRFAYLTGIGGIILGIVLAIIIGMPPITWSAPL